jgi:hypothetical protein
LSRWICHPCASAKRMCSRSLCTSPHASRTGIADRFGR